jgi:hypothetical protein
MPPRRRARNGKIGARRAEPDAQLALQAPTPQKSPPSFCVNSTLGSAFPLAGFAIKYETEPSPLVATEPTIARPRCLPEPSFNTSTEAERDLACGEIGHG